MLGFGDGEVYLGSPVDIIGQQASWQVSDDGAYASNTPTNVYIVVTPAVEQDFPQQIELYFSLEALHEPLTPGIYEFATPMAYPSQREAGFSVVVEYACDLLSGEFQVVEMDAVQPDGDAGEVATIYHSFTIAFVQYCQTPPTSVPLVGCAHFEM
jgi:hypothetical protein